MAASYRHTDAYITPSRPQCMCCQASTEVALDLLLSLAEEGSALDSRAQASFVHTATQPQAAQVFDILGKVLQGSSSASGDDTVVPMHAESHEASMKAELRGDGSCIVCIRMLTSVCVTCGWHQTCLCPFLAQAKLTDAKDAQYSVMLTASFSRHPSLTAFP